MLQLNINHLEHLPEEVLYLLFQFLSPHDIGHLALTAKTMRNLVETWVDTNVCVHHLIPGRALENGREEDRFKLKLTVCRQFAVLAKRTTFLYNTQRRLELVTQWFGRLNTHINGSLTGDWGKVTDVVCYSALLQTFSRGWDESEFPRVVEQLDDRYSFGQTMVKLLQGGKGKNRVSDQEEAELRLVLRSFFWDQAHEGAAGTAWLSQLLLQNNLSYRQQAVLLYLVLGPVCVEHKLSERRDYDKFQLETIQLLYTPADWAAPQMTTPDFFEEARDMFSDIGRGLQCLQSTDISPAQLLSAVFRLTSPTSSHTFSSLTAFSWHTDNRAGCLLFTTELVVTAYLKLELEVGSSGRVARLMVAMLVVCDRLDNELLRSEGLKRILDWVMSAKELEERTKFYKEFS